MSFEIKLGQSITVEEAYKNIIDGCLRVYNTRLQKEFIYCAQPVMNNKVIEVVGTDGDSEFSYDLVKCPDTIEDFIEKYGESDWYYGYIDDDHDNK